MRLSNDKREIMLAFAMKNTTNPELIKASKKLESLNTKADACAHKAVAERFPADKMDVLKQFKVTTKDYSWKFKIKNAGNADIIGYKLSDQENCFTVADSWELRRRVFEVSKADWKLMSDCKQLRKDISKLQDQIESDFKNALYACTTFKQALGIWPKFADIEEKICHRDVACVSEEVVERIGKYKVK